MELSISSYLSPWTSFDYSLRLKICICGKWMESTTRSHAAINLAIYASELAEFNCLSDEVLLDVSNCPDGVMVFRLTIVPDESGELALVELNMLEVLEEGDAIFDTTLLERVPIHEINALGNSLLGVACNDLFDFDFSTVR